MNNKQEFQAEGEDYNHTSKKTKLPPVANSILYACG